MNIQFEISDQEVAKLDEMLKKTGLTTYEDLFNNTLNLFYWATEQVKTGRIIASVDKEAQKYTEAKMPVLDYVAQTTLTEETETQPIAA
jgi:hypothetical protein